MIRASETDVMTLIHNTGLELYTQMGPLQTAGLGTLW